MTFRIKFAKYGVVRYIGHLDVMRYFQKVIRRSGLPVTYSQGFSPHQLMSFALPLSVGVTSDGEYMEVEFDEDKLVKEVEQGKMQAGMSEGTSEGTSDRRLAGMQTEMSEGTSEGRSIGAQDDIKHLLEKYIFDGLSSNTTEGFAILGVKQLPKPEPNKHVDKAMALVSAADYLISVKDGYEDCVGFKSQDEFMRAFEKFIGQETIEVTKKTKKNEKQLNLKEFIYGYGDENGFLVGDEVAQKKKIENGAEKGTVDEIVNGAANDTTHVERVSGGTAHARRFANGMQLALRIAAGSVVNIKPEMVLEAFLESLGREFDKNAFAMHRMELYLGEPGSFRALI
ncbi:MAG: TIGR03936 family radical SAM-associated protein [Lachnospiraceae bacterium]|nr:TIGR03936 family radical SAM-associated protein [Lachnospiraceae bacterium]